MTKSELETVRVPRMLSILRTSSCLGFQHAKTQDRLCFHLLRSGCA